MQLFSDSIANNEVDFGDNETTTTSTSTTTATAASFEDVDQEVDEIYNRLFGKSETNTNVSKISLKQEGGGESVSSSSKTETSKNFNLDKFFENLNNPKTTQQLFAGVDKKKQRVTKREKEEEYDDEDQEEEEVEQTKYYIPKGGNKSRDILGSDQRYSLKIYQQTLTKQIRATQDAIMSGTQSEQDTYHANFLIENIPDDYKDNDLEHLIIENINKPLKSLHFERVRDTASRSQHSAVFVAAEYYRDEEAARRLEKQQEKLLEKRLTANDQSVESNIDSIVAELSVAPTLDDGHGNIISYGAVPSKLSLKPIKKSNSPDTVYKRFDTFGFTIDGQRYKVIESNKLKSIKIFNIPRYMNQEDVYAILNDHFSNGIARNFTINLPKPRTNSHQPETDENNGKCVVTFASHMDAVNAYQQIPQLHFGDHQRAHCQWSRFIQGDNSPQSLLATKMSRSKNRLVAELSLMRKVLDLSSRVKEQEEESNSNNNNKN
ncbi:hypothetical protein DFA_02549 [Cavenderia fasciculata]|uniref:Uncharacterized protein n=1 Tax=Cavenderia fasciculata TaxID=261658 RepID=F4PZP6_CACFS|nr:uncharacterized protein DFA_02549 [Cavenderia fasciculata]EGG18810.1 hypothetical protein DFA_02549 [Cavenderia fasciculata]|eukprot:XP_004357272.1 hypothetical protein DFA_02549 [Cavenderia fasciculata]